jgi:hypothetical protein
VSLLKKKLFVTKKENALTSLGDGKTVNKFVGIYLYCTTGFNLIAIRPSSQPLVILNL